MAKITQAELTLLNAECVRIRETIDSITRRNPSAGALAKEILPRVGEIERILDSINTDQKPE
jgi:hypothetical protein